MKPTVQTQAMGDKAANRAEQANPSLSDGADFAPSKPKAEAPAAGHTPRGPPTDASAPAMPTGAPVAAYSKTLDYKSCQTIMCLTKEMARHLLPSVPASVTATGALLFDNCYFVLILPMQLAAVMTVHPTAPVPHEALPCPVDADCFKAPRHPLPVVRCHAAAPIAPK